MSLSNSHHQQLLYRFCCCSRIEQDKPTPLPGGRVVTCTMPRLPWPSRQAVAQPTTPRLAALAAEPVAAAELVQVQWWETGPRYRPCKKGLKIHGFSLGFHPHKWPYGWGNWSFFPHVNGRINGKLGFISPRTQWSYGPL